MSIGNFLNKIVFVSTNKISNKEIVKYKFQKNSTLLEINKTYFLPQFFFWKLPLNYKILGPFDLIKSIITNYLF